MRVLFALLLCAVLLTSCVPITPTPTGPTPTPSATPSEVVKLSPPRRDECNAIVSPIISSPANPTPNPIVVKEIEPQGGQERKLRTAFVDGYLIVSGFGNSIEDVIRLTNAELGDKVPGGLVWRSEQWLILPESNAYGLGTRLYEFTPTKDIDALGIAAIVRETAIQAKSPVFADVDLIGFANADDRCGLEGSPLSGEGSPLSGEGSPLSGEGSPLGVPGGMTQADLFWKQWAFGKEPGIAISDGASRRGDLTTGAKSEIIIFDTSPFTRTGEYIFDGPDWSKTELSVCVEHPVPVALSEIPGCRGLADESDHGVFVAGLADAVAPDATLRLVRVLDSHGKGELRDFLYALGHLNRPDLTGTVLNMSLGFLPTAEPKAPVSALCKEAGLDGCAGLLKQLKSSALPPSLVKDLINQDGITLFLAIRNALDAGAVISAAAGNYGTGGPARPAQLPAAFAQGNPTLLAVAGTTKTGARAFYSHMGTVAAPGGGNNVNRCEKGASPDCNANLDAWIISVARHQDNTPGEYWSYGAWMGTSFSTPLVSGAVALRLADGENPFKAADSASLKVCPSVPPGDSDLGAGILCVP